jgi:cytochrome c biogenesis protein CcmG, thiol:disulfide interchange protein DsbE
MKRALFVIAALILSGCSSPEPVAIKGEVISCGSVTSDKTITKGISVECVDGSAGAIIESLRGPMIINVWGSWCSTCLAETPEFVSFYKKAKGKVQLVGVAVEESSPENSEKFIIENGMTWPNFYDRKDKTRSYFGMGVPVTWFIDAEGAVKFKKYGEVKSEQELIDLTEKHLGVKI